MASTRRDAAGSSAVGASTSAVTTIRFFMTSTSATLDTWSLTTSSSLTFDQCCPSTERSRNDSAVGGAAVGSTVVSVTTPGPVVVGPGNPSASDPAERISKPVNVDMTAPAVSSTSMSYCSPIGRAEPGRRRSESSGWGIHEVDVYSVPPTSTVAEPKPLSSRRVTSPCVMETPPRRAMASTSTVAVTTTPRSPESGPDPSDTPTAWRVEERCEIGLRPGSPID
jgi:hypothetical protein